MPRNHRYPVDLSDFVVLITDGINGVGLETALAFSEYGAQCVLTYPASDQDTADGIARFDAINGKPPRFIQADITKAGDTLRLMQSIQSSFGRLDAIIINPLPGPRIESVSDYTLPALRQTLSGGAWPLAGYMQHAEQVFGTPPKYVIAVSKLVNDTCTPGQDFNGVSTAVLETMVKYISHRYLHRGLVINVVCLSGPCVDMDEGGTSYVADTLVGLCSGYCDSIKGQMITVKEKKLSNQATDSFQVRAGSLKI